MSDALNPLPDVFRRVRLLALDVDGVLTDGGVYFDQNGVETKRFHIHDGLGIVVAGLAGLKVVWITGRNSPIVERRARELNVAVLRQGVRDKATALREIAAELGVDLEAICYMGDDLNDLPALRLAGAPIAPANCVSAEVRATALWITPRSGGAGAVRDAIEAILKAQGEWDAAVAQYLTTLSPSTKNPLQ